MWQVLVQSGGDIIDASADRGLIEGTITEGVNEFASFAFTLLPSSEAYSYITPLTTQVIVMDGTQVRYHGRVLTQTPSMSQSGLVQKKVICEDRMAYLCDSVQPYTPVRQYDGDGTINGLQEFLDVILANHNAQVEEYKQIFRGNVTVTTYISSEGVYKGLNYETTWDAIKSKILDVFGGEMRIRESGGLLYLDYADSLGATRTTEIELGQNMIQASHTLDPANVVSRLIPLGAKLTVQLEDDAGNITEQETDERLTIDTVNDGSIYLESQTAEALYGLQYKAVIWDDVHDPQILKTKGTNYLTAQNRAMATYSVAALDLSYIGQAIDEFALFDSYPVRNDEIGLNATLEVIKKTTDIFEPYNPRLTFGDKAINLADIVAGNVSKIAQNVTNVSLSQTNILNRINQVYTLAQDTATSLVQTEENITASVTQVTTQQSATDELVEKIVNAIQMDANGTTMIFQTIMEAISNVDDAQASNYAEILKYIRFENGSIILGEVGNETTLTLVNNRLSIMQNGVEVAYFSDNKMDITDGQFEHSLQLGNFAFYPRDNGNLSFSRVGV